MTLNNLYYFNEIVKDMNLALRPSGFTTQQALSGHIKGWKTTSASAFLSVPPSSC